MKIQDFFAESFYINLDRRTERRAMFEAEMARVGLSDFVKRYPAAIDATHLPQDDYNRHRACGQSQYNLIKYAADKGLPNILIFEDDAYFYDAGNKPGLSIVEAALDSMSKIPAWDLFYLSCTPIFDALPPRPAPYHVDEHLVRVYGVLTGHAWAINHTAYENLLLYNPATDAAFDGCLSNNFELVKYMAYPLAVPQRAGPSDCDAYGYASGDFSQTYARLAAELAANANNGEQP